MTHKCLKINFALLLIVTVLITSNLSKAIFYLKNELKKPIYLDITCKGKGDLGGAKLIPPNGETYACDNDYSDEEPSVNIDRDWGKEDGIEKWRDIYANSQMKDQQLIINRDPYEHPLTRGRLYRLVSLTKRGIIF